MSLNLERTLYLGKNVQYLRERIHKEPTRPAPQRGEMSVAAPPRRGAPNSRTMTQTELGEIIGVTQGLIGNIERGDALGSVPTVSKLAAFFNVSMDELLHVDLAERDAAQADKVLAA